MPERLKVLMSAYACEPGKGSEPEVGWQWALQMARFHDVTVITRANNRENIERELIVLRGKQPLPDFVYHEESAFLLRLKERLRLTKFYYLLWQRSARILVTDLHAEKQFDLLHHVTFAGIRYPTPIWGHGAPCVWGPIGGIESVPFSLLPWAHPISLFAEVKRNIHNLIQSAPAHILPKRARASTVILTSTFETQRAFFVLGFETQLMPTIGLLTDTLPSPVRRESEGPLKILFVGNIITLKGVDLALESFKASRTDATFTLIGSGNYLDSARRLTEKLQLGNRVNFPGRAPRAEVLQQYSQYDLFLFPSLHDTGGYAVIEAMFNELPVICLDCGGPAVAIRDNCGIKIPMTNRAKVIAGLADAIRFYDNNREKMREHGRNARKVILENYNWEKKGEQMNEIYKKAMEAAPNKPLTAKKSSYTGIGGAPHILHRVVSVRGVLATLLTLVFVGLIGFFTLTHVRKSAADIVNNTLPRLSLGGLVNAYLGDASRTLLYIVSDDPERRKTLRAEAEALSKRTSAYLEEYGKSTDASEDRGNYLSLIEQRKNYFVIRSHIIELADQGKKEEALAEFNQIMLPAHTRIKQAGDEMFAYNIRQGEQRSHAIMAACTITQVAVAVISVIVFVLGFFIGLFR